MSLLIMTKKVSEKIDCEEVVIRTDEGAVYSEILNWEQAQNLSLDDMTKIWDKYPIGEFTETYNQAGFDFYFGSRLQMPIKIKRNCSKGK